MAKKYFQRALSVGLSLALCASMVAPGFAASFADLQGAIDGGNSVLKDGLTEVDTTKSDEENYKIKVENKDDTRVVTLYEDVKAEKGESSIVIGKKGEDDLSKNVTLDLNGHAIDLNPGWTAMIQDTGEEASNPVPFRDKDGNYDWALSEGPNMNDDIITIEKDATLTLEDSEAKWTGNLYFDPSNTDSLPSSVPEYKGGKITGGAYHAISNQGTLIMNGGELSGNAWDAVNNRGNFVMNGGVIRNNKIAVMNSNRFTMNGGQISENNGYGAIGLENGGSIFTMNDGVIAGNRVGCSAIFASDGGNTAWSVGSQKVFIQGGTIDGNRYGGCGSRDGAIMLYNNLGTVTLPEGSDPVQANEDGSIDFPAGTKIKHGNIEYVSVNDGIHVEIDGCRCSSYVSKTENWDKSVTITATNGTQNTITDTNGGEVTLNSDGTTTLSKGGKINKGNTETTYLDKTTINADGTVSTDGETVKKTENSDGTVTITGTNDNRHEITDTNGGKALILQLILNGHPINNMEIRHLK